MHIIQKTVLCGLVASTVSGCGLYIPAKDELRSEAPDKFTAYPYSEQGAYESGVVGHIACEIAIGLAQIEPFELSWLKKWGTSVTLTITSEDQGGISPGVSFISPLRNVVKAHPMSGKVAM